MSTKRETDIEADITTMEALAAKAEKAGAFTPAVQARSKAAALRAELSRLRDEAAANREADPVARIQRLRRRASEDGSYVAAANLLKQENELAEEQRRREEEERKAARRTLTPDEMISNLVQKIRAMPESMQANIRERLGWG